MTSALGTTRALDAILAADRNRHPAPPPVPAHVAEAISDRTAHDPGDESEHDIVVPMRPRETYHLRWERIDPWADVAATQAPIGGRGRR